MKTYPLILLIFTGILAVAGLGLYFLLPAGWMSSQLPQIYLLFFSTSFLIHLFLKRSEGKTPAQFVNRYMLTTVIKMFLYIGVVVCYAFFNPRDIIVFVINFAVLYLCYMIFDMAMLVRQKK